METEKYDWDEFNISPNVNAGFNNLTFELGTHFKFDADVLVKKNATFEGDVSIGNDSTFGKLRVTHEATFIKPATFDSWASGNFILNAGSYIPDEVLRYTTVIKDLENLAIALRKDYFYKHFCEWIECSNK